MFTASADVQVGFQLLKADQSHILDKRSPLAETQKLSKKVANIAKDPEVKTFKIPSLGR